MDRKEQSKLIIHNLTNLSDWDVLHYIIKVVQEGLVSETKNGKQYSFVTTFIDGYTVVTSKNKQNTHTFWIYKENSKEYDHE